MNKEAYFIQQFSNSKFIGDDGAAVGKWVYSMDAFCEHVHFKRHWMSLKQIAQKAMLVNISDAIAMNAKPKYALLSVAIPKDFSAKQLKQLGKGFKQAAKMYDIEIIGGDTIANDRLDISITIISKTKKPLLRSNMKEGDYICYTGDLGSCKKDLEALLRNETIEPSSKFITPKLKADFLYQAAPYMNAGLDISDGLFFELQRLSQANHLGFEFLKQVDKQMGCSGEEYELLFTFKPKHLEKIKKIAKKYKVKLNIVAKAIQGSYKCECKGHHF
jgi:thiamine-monophosphate kinase